MFACHCLPQRARLRGEEAVGASEVAETDRLVVDRVEAREHVDERVAAPPRVLGREPRHVVGRTQDPSVDAFHHVEGRAVHVVVLAQGVDARHGHVGGCQRGDHAVLARHVVRGRDDVTERRAPQHPCACAVGDGVREVGATAGDELGVQWRAGGTGNVLGEPRRESLEIETFGCFVHAPPCRGEPREPIE